jgi:hypothetical protein
MTRKHEPGRDAAAPEGSSSNPDSERYGGSNEPPWVEDLRVLAQREQFRLAAQLVAREFSALVWVQRVALIGSVAALPKRERPRWRRRGSGALTWHEPKDVDLAVCVTATDHLTELRKARSRGVDELVARTGLGVAHHQVDVFILDAASGEYLGCLCIFGQCPKGKPECSVPHCGARPFLRQFSDFHFDPTSASSPGAVTLFDRRLKEPGLRI